MASLQRDGRCEETDMAFVRYWTCSEMAGHTITRSKKPFNKGKLPPIDI